MRRFSDRESCAVYNLPRSLKNTSGSSWSAKHLQACRVLVKDFNGTIPVLRDYIEEAEVYVAGNQALIASLAAVSREELRILPHRMLRSVPNFGSFYVALADVTRVRGLEVSTRSLRRDIQAPARPAFRSGEGEGLSSSPTQGSSPLTSTSVYSPGHVDEQPDFEEQIDRKKHEIVCTNMAAQFISTIVDLYSSQLPENISVEFCNAPNEFRLDSPHLSCICQDDGGLWHREFQAVTRTWINPQGRLLCSLEAKSSYSKADDSGIGATSERTLAQQFCELLGSVLSQIEDGNFEALDIDLSR